MERCKATGGGSAARRGARRPLGWEYRRAFALLGRLSLPFRSPSLLDRRLPVGEVPVRGVYAGNQALAGCEAEEEGGDAEEDRYGAEPAGAEKVAEYAEHRADGARRYARAGPEKGADYAADAEKEAEEAAEPAGQQLHRPLAPGVRLLARATQVFAGPSAVLVVGQPPAVPVVGQDRSCRVCQVCT